MGVASIGRPLKIFGGILFISLAVIGLWAAPQRVLSDEIHDRPVTTHALSPAPTSLGAGLLIYSDPVTVTLSATVDPDFSLGATYYKVDGGTPQTYTGPFTVSGMGKHGVEYWSADNSGIEELPRKSTGFTIGYKHGLVNSIAQNGINIDVSVHFDDWQAYVNQIFWGPDCYVDLGGSFELYNAVTGALVSSQRAEAHCGNAGNGNAWLSFPPIALPSGTYFIHYSGGSNDWITENYVYTAPILHNPPVSSSSLSPAPSTPGNGLVIYPDPVTVTLSAVADSGYSISNIYYKIDGGAQQTYTGPFTVGGVQKHNVEYWSVDNTNFEEPTHKNNGFTVGYKHGIINSITQSGNFIDVSVNFDNWQAYVGQIFWGPDCYVDLSGSFEIYNAATGARIASQRAEAHCGNAGNGNAWLGFPPLQLPTGTYFIHYSGGNLDWITENYSFTAPVPAHNNPATTATLSPNPTTVASNLVFYDDPVTVTLAAVADVGYTATTYYKLDGGPQQVYTVPFTVSGMGKHGFEYWSVDNTTLEELPHKSMGFAIGYKHGTILSLAQNPISIDITVNFDDWQAYVNQVFWGPDCYVDLSGSFELYNALTGALVSSQRAEAHCGNAGNGNAWLGFPPLLLPPGTYFVHYSGGSNDWVSDPYVYSPTPKTTISLATQEVGGTYTDPTTVTLSAVAAVGTTLGNTYYKIDGGAQQTYTGPFTVSGGGGHSVEYWSVDTVGVEENHKTEPFTIHAASPVTLTLNSIADTNVRSGQSNRNYGAETFMRLQSSGSNRALVRFDQAAMAAAIGNGSILSAKLRLTITDNGNNWGTAGRTVDVHRLLASWAEGSGTEGDRGTGLGATWSCATDNLIENLAKDCSGITEWEMGQPNNPSVHPWAQTATATQTITSGQSGIVEFDVTADVAAFLSGANDYGWILKKTDEGQNGQISFGTKESSAVPQLVVVYQP